MSENSIKISISSRNKEVQILIWSTENVNPVTERGMIYFQIINTLSFIILMHISLFFPFATEAVLNNVIASLYLSNGAF